MLYNAGLLGRVKLDELAFVIDILRRLALLYTCAAVGVSSNAHVRYNERKFR